MLFNERGLFRRRKFSLLCWHFRNPSLLDGNYLVSAFPESVPKKVPPDVRTKPLNRRRHDLAISKRDAFDLLGIEETSGVPGRLGTKLLYERGVSSVRLALPRLGKSAFALLLMRGSPRAPEEEPLLGIHVLLVLDGTTGSLRQFSPRFWLGSYPVLLIRELFAFIKSFLAATRQQQTKHWPKASVLFLSFLHPLRVKCRNGSQKPL